MAKKPQPAPPRRHSGLVWMVLFYVAALATMVALNRYAFVLKIVVVPVLLLAAVLSGRFKRFVNDWVVFFAAVELFEFLRGFVFAVTSHFKLPMYLNYVIEWDRWLGGGTVSTVALQQLRSSLADPTWMDRFFVLVYSSHFVFFLLVGFAIWSSSRHVFRTYAFAILAVMYGGLVFYLLVPTIPPWMAASDFLVLPEIVQPVRDLYNVHWPALFGAFDVNAIAAFPSLHAGLPAMCALLAWRYLGGWRWLVVLYTCVVWVAIIYLGEHYLIDVVAGALLALVVNVGVHLRGAPPEVAVTIASGQHEQFARQPIAVALGLIAVAYGVGLLTIHWRGPLPITRAFVARELSGRSPAAHYLLGRIALAEGEFAEAQKELDLALDDLAHPVQQKVIRTHLGASASCARDFAGVVAALEPLQDDADDVDNLTRLGIAYVEEGTYERGIMLLRDARGRFPSKPEPLYWLARYQYVNGRVDAPEVERAVDALKRLPATEAEPLRRSLLAILGLQEVVWVENGVHRSGKPHGSRV